METRRRPGEIRDAILSYLSVRDAGANAAEIRRAIQNQFRDDIVAASSVRSYLNLNTPGSFERTSSGKYRLRGLRKGAPLGARNALAESFRIGRAELFHADCIAWLREQKSETIHGVVTDPPYGLVEYSDSEQAKRKAGRGGVWRIPPSFDGHRRSPVPRFTTLRHEDLCNLVDFFYEFGRCLLPVLVPGAHVLIASNPLVSYAVAGSLVDAGFERRGEIVRLVMTLRGGDRPKNAHAEFADVTVMPRSMWEPWLLFRKPIDGRVQDNLRRWKTGGLRRLSADQPFADVVRSEKTPQRERRIAEHPTLKPQSFLRHVVRAILPLGEGVVLDPFAGSGSTLAAAEHLGLESRGVEISEEFFAKAMKAIGPLSRLETRRI